MSSISILQELCDRNKTPYPVYELLADGSSRSRDRVFIYQCTAQFETAQGHGKSKKEAKYDAASNILKLINYQIDDKKSVIPEDVVGDLIKLCSKMKIDDPQYNLLNESGLPHNVEFTYECCVGSSHRVVAQHNTKKGAKKLAAHKMFQLINLI